MFYTVLVTLVTGILVEYPIKVSSYKSDESRKINFSICSMTLGWSRKESVMQIYGVRASPQFGIYRYSASGELMYLFYHVTSRDYLIRVQRGVGRLCNFMGGSSLQYFTILTNLRDQRYCYSGNIKFRNCPLTSRTCLKVYVNLLVEAPHNKSLSCLLLWPLVYSRSRYKILNLLCELTKQKRDSEIRDFLRGSIVWEQRGLHITTLPSLAAIDIVIVET